MTTTSLPWGISRIEAGQRQWVCNDSKEPLGFRKYTEAMEYTRTLWNSDPGVHYSPDLFHPNEQVKPKKPMDTKRTPFSWFYESLHARVGLEKNA